MNLEFDPTLNNPYVGPRPFERGDKLFGREREKRELRDLLIGQRVVLLHSPSGAGKTSLIQAGLLPLLDPGDPAAPEKKSRRATLRVLPTIRVSLEPPREFAAQHPALNRYVFSTLLSLEGQPSSPGAGQADPVPPRRMEELAPLRLAEYVAERRKSAPDEGGGLGALLILDQFEEVLTLNPIDAGAKIEFFAQAGELLADTGLFALFAMREEYIGGLEPYFRSLPDGLANRYRLDLLGTAQAWQAIQGPAAAVEPPVAFQDEAARALVEDLARVNVQQADGSVTPQPGQYVEPVQLSVVCQRLWNKRRGPSVIDQGDLDALRVTVDPAGGSAGETLSIVDQALQAYYDEQVTAAAIPPGSAPEQADIREAAVSSFSLERAVREWFDRQLILPKGLRGQVLKEAGRTQGLDNKAIDRLEDGHLIRAEQRRGLTWFELAHDRLVAPVQRSNRGWFEQNLQPFQRQARLWQAEGTPRSRLLAEPELNEARQFEARSPDRINDLDRLFLRDSQAALAPLDPEQWKRLTLRAQHGLNLHDTGWGIIFSSGLPVEQRDGIKLALQELLDLRRRQATEKQTEYYREFSSSLGYLPGETARQFIARHEADTGLNTTAKIPYYLLIVGGPDQIPFDFQYGLDERYAVGRLAFDTLEEYAGYARSVVEAESGAWSLPKTAALFAPQFAGDPAAELNTRDVMEPLAARLRGLPGWTSAPYLGDQASKANLAQLLGGPQTPALLFANTLALSPAGLDDPGQVAAYSGALICQDWPGFDSPKPTLAPGEYFAAGDIGPDGRLLGLVAFLFAPFSAGTPAVDDFSFLREGGPRRYAPQPFVARLAQRLLGHPLGGALAVIGHVDTQYTYSFLGAKGAPDIAAIGLVLERLMDGHTAGSAMEALNQRYNNLFALLADSLVTTSIAAGQISAAQFEQMRLKELMTRAFDARNYILLGDPAVHLPIAEEGAAASPAGGAASPAGGAASPAGGAASPAGGAASPAGGAASPVGEGRPAIRPVGALQILPSSQEPPAPPTGGAPAPRGAGGPPGVEPRLVEGPILIGTATGGPEPPPPAESLSLGMSRPIDAGEPREALMSSEEPPSPFRSFDFEPYSPSAPVAKGLSPQPAAGAVLMFNGLAAESGRYLLELPQDELVAMIQAAAEATRAVSKTWRATEGRTF